MRDITTMELVHEMGIGINLGNTLEATDAPGHRWISRTGGISAFERALGSPIITEELIIGYANAGFGVVRIPVAWSNLMSEDGEYTIYPKLMERVEEITQWVIKHGMYAIINIHWDGGWWDSFPTEKEESMKRYTRIWEQICERFKDFCDMLMFESANEELGWNSLWNRWGGSASGKRESFGLANEINQTFVDLVRASGGNNGLRHLLIAGYYTDIELTVDPLFQMPNDPMNRCAVSVHYYTPSVFAILERDADWGRVRMNWGTEADYRELNRLMDLVKHRFIDDGVPVILGEFGSPRPALKDEGAVFRYITSVAEASFVRGMAPILWDITITEIPERGVFFSRVTNTMIDPEMEARFREIAAMERPGG
jgi:endoglucanase